MKIFRDHGGDRCGSGLLKRRDSRRKGISIRTDQRLVRAISKWNGVEERSLRFQNGGSDFGDVMSSRQSQLPPKPTEFCRNWRSVTMSRFQQSWNTILETRSIRIGAEKVRANVDDWLHRHRLPRVSRELMYARPYCKSSSCGCRVLQNNPIFESGRMAPVQRVHGTGTRARGILGISKQVKPPRGSHVQAKSRPCRR